MLIAIFVLSLINAIVWIGLILSSIVSAWVELREKRRTSGIYATGMRKSKRQSSEIESKDIKQ